MKLEKGVLSLLCTFKFDEQKIALSTFHRNLNKSCNCFYLSWLRAIISANYLSALGWVDVVQGCRNEKNIGGTKPTYFGVSSSFFVQNHEPMCQVEIIKI